MIAKTFQGLEEILAEELTTLGANDIQIGRRMVSFTGDKRMMYKANFCLRTAIRILKPIKNFTAKDADEVYNQIQAIPWEEYLDVNKTFAIDAVVFSEEFRHSKFVSYKVKDAIVDYFREKTGKRPSVRINNPDVLLNIHIAHTTCTLSLDSSGESLHRRGYRQEQVEAPLNEVLAAGMVLMTGWRGECDLIDPMCGSGTIPIEAALIARNIAPGVFRKGFAFEKWVDFDSEMFDEIYNDDSQEPARNETALSSPPHPSGLTASHLPPRGKAYKEQAAKQPSKNLNLHRRSVPKHLPDTLLRLAPGEHDLPAASLAAELEVHTHPEDEPLLAATGVGLFHLQHVVHMDIHETYTSAILKPMPQTVLIYSRSLALPSLERRLLMWTLTVLSSPK